jgi:CubicO group peptidase (beta-lactamase class C family)
MKIITIILISIVITISGSAQTKSIQSTLPLSGDSPRSVGISEERLERIDQMLINAIENNLIPGAVALIARNGKIVYHKAFGLADSETNKSLRRDDIFRIASQTKAITSTAIMMLWEEGKFRLDDPISKYIPEFENAGILDSLV